MNSSLSTRRRSCLSTSHSKFYRIPSSTFKIVVFLFILSISVFILNKIDDYASQIASETKTVAGHNLDQTPWHHFTPKQFNENSKYSKASKFLKCSSALKCSSHRVTGAGFGFPANTNKSSTDYSTCPSYFRWIHRDLEPWAKSRISSSKLMEAQKSAAFRVLIIGGKLYVDFYYSCFQSRMMFTIWGLVQLLKKYPGLIPDVDLMFDCMDRPVVNRDKFKPLGSWPPPPLFRYCTTDEHFDLPFPDWSFWGWYKIYAEGFAWSVSLKYIISCGSPTLIISQQFKDFFSRGLVPKVNYLPVTPARNLCRSIKNAVDWGNSNPSQAEEIGRRGQNLMGNLSMDKVYDYMFHLIVEYSKLLDFKPIPTSTAQEICAESILCYADSREREFLEKSTATSSLSLPCDLPADHEQLKIGGRK